MWGLQYGLFELFRVISVGLQYGLFELFRVISVGVTIRAVCDVSCDQCRGYNKSYLSCFV